MELEIGLHGLEHEGLVVEDELVDVGEDGTEAEDLLDVEAEAEAVGELDQHQG